jgi:predicted DNA-binding WGR domain protein
MSDWTVHLEFEEGTSSKFWRARVEGKTLYVNYGKIGSNGQTQVKQLGDPDAAQAEYDKLVREKRRKGYVDAGGGGGGDEEEEQDEDGDEGDDEEEEEEEEEAPRKPAPAPKAAAPAAAAPRSGGTRLVLEAGNRKVETTLWLDGKTVRMEAVETYATPEAAKKAHERLKKTLAGEGYNPG